jgi:hypothetical protein
MAALFLLLSSFVAVLFFDFGEWLGLVYVRDFTEHPIHQWVLYLSYAMLLVLGMFLALWLILFVMALAGSTRQLPVIKQLTRKRWILRCSLITNSVALALIPFIAVLVFHATTLTRPSQNGRAAVYFLYDEGIGVPRCAYALWLYRVSLQAQRNWGKNSIVLDRMNKATLQTALGHGKVVILATHGADGYACTYYAPEKLGVGPPDKGASNELNSSRFLRTSIFGADNKPGKWDDINVNDQLRLLYLFGCNAGKKASQWEQHLAPAQVISYDRYSSVIDHALWFGLTGPAQLRNLR